MSITDDIFGQFKTAWDVGSPAHNGGVVIPVQWPNVDVGFPPPPDKPWVRVTIKHLQSFQATLGPTGSRKFTRRGLFTAQVFCPKNRGGGTTPSEALGTIIRDAFEGKSTTSGVWFRNVLVQEIGPDDAWDRRNVVVQFEYDETK